MEKEKVLMEINMEISAARSDYNIIEELNSDVWSEAEHDAYIKGMERVRDIVEGE